MPPPGTETSSSSSMTGSGHGWGGTSSHLLLFCLSNPFLPPLFSIPPDTLQTAWRNTQLSGLPHTQQHTWEAASSAASGLEERMKYVPLPSEALWVFHPSKLACALLGGVTQTSCTAFYFLLLFSLGLWLCVCHSVASCG